MKNIYTFSPFPLILAFCPSSHRRCHRHCHSFESRVDEMKTQNGTKKCVRVSRCTLLQCAKKRISINLKGKQTVYEWFGWFFFSWSLHFLFTLLLAHELWHASNLLTNERKCTSNITLHFAAIVAIIYCLQMNWIIVFCVFIALDCLSLFDGKAIMELSFWIHFDFFNASHIKMTWIQILLLLPKQNDLFSLLLSLSSCESEQWMMRYVQWQWR